MQIIPAIDIMEGKSVRLVQGNYDRVTVYDNDPLDTALRFEDAGLKRLHLVDLDGAKAGLVKNWKVLEKLASKTNLIIDFSGGISDLRNLQIAFDSGAAIASVGSMAVREEGMVTEWLDMFGTDRFIIAADVKDELIVIKGWTETTKLYVYDLIRRYVEKGVQHFFCTDVNLDGMLKGPSIPLYKKILEELPSIRLIASGGVATLEDIENIAEAGCDAVIIGKALHENRIRLADLKPFVSA